MSPESLQSFFALAIGFAVAGLISTGYQALTQRPASFSLLEQGAHPSTFAAVPLLAFAAPFIIMRNTVRGRRIEHRRFEFVMILTIFLPGLKLNDIRPLLAIQTVARNYLS